MKPRMILRKDVLKRYDRITRKIICVSQGLNGRILELRMTNISVLGIWKSIEATDLWLQSRPQTTKRLSIDKTERSDLLVTLQFFVCLHLLRVGRIGHAEVGIDPRWSVRLKVDIVLPQKILISCYPGEELFIRSPFARSGWSGSFIKTLCSGFVAVGARIALVTLHLAARTERTSKSLSV